LIGYTSPEMPNACPGCEIGRDPATYVVTWCHYHEPSRGGVDDEVVDLSFGLGNSTLEAGGEDNRAWCEFFHRKRMLLRGPA